MTIRRARVAVATLVLLPFLAPPWAGAQQQPPPSPSPSAANRAMLQPLIEIGRVRARSPYCAALARARVGSDAAVAYEYQTPQVAADLRSFRFDSGLHRELALRRTERDLQALWDLARAGRADVRALREAASKPDVEPQQRDEMLAYANALDGAKDRQMMLAKSIARVVGIYAEVPIRTIANDAHDDGQSSSSMRGKFPTFSRTDSSPPPVATTQTTLDAIDASTRAQDLFQTFSAERWIHDDLATASVHAAAAIKAGHCADPAP